MSHIVSNLVSGAPSAGAPNDVTSPSHRLVNIQYHTLPGDRFPQQTRLDLISAGIPASALGYSWDYDDPESLDLAMDLEEPFARAVAMVLVGFGAPLDTGGDTNTASFVVPALVRTMSRMRLLGLGFPDIPTGYRDILAFDMNALSWAEERVRRVNAALPQW